MCVLACVHSQRGMSVDEDLPSQKKAPLPLFSFMQPVPTLLSLLWQPALSPWALHASNQSETFVEIPPGSTYSTYPTGTASVLKRLEQREERLPRQSMVWHQKLGLRGRVTGNAEVARSQELQDARRKQKNRVAAHGHGQFQWKLCGIGFVIGSLRAWILGKYRVALALV